MRLQERKEVSAFQVGESSCCISLGEGLFGVGLSQINEYIYNFIVEMLQSSFFLFVTVQLLWLGGKTWFSEGGVEPAKAAGGEFG